MNVSCRNATKNAQQGAVLIVSLVILLIVTLIGVASMRSSNLELKMAISARDRAVSFEAAEAALSVVESRLNGAYSLVDLTSAFNEQCTGGLCFRGSFAYGDERGTCSIARQDNVKPVWAESAVWQNAPNEKISINPGESGTVEEIDVQYLVEFLCFVPRGDDNLADSTGSAGNHNIPLYRVTVRSSGQGDRATVMLQSTYQAAERNIGEIL